MALTRPSLTPAEFAATMARAGWRAPMELIDGEVIVIPPSGADAAFAQTELVHRLRDWQMASSQRGRVLADVFIRIGQGFLAPDVAWWADGREPDIGPGAVQTVPNLVVEVLSPATRANDLGPKRDEYLEAGVRELWLVDPAGRSVLRVNAEHEHRLAARDTLGSPLLPGLAVTVAELFG